MTDNDSLQDEIIKEEDVSGEKGGKVSSDDTYMNEDMDDEEGFLGNLEMELDEDYL